MSGITDLLKTALPFIGTALGGPLGAGVATFIAGKIGCDPSTAITALTTMVGDPATIQQARDLEAAYKTHLADLSYTSLAQVETLNASVVESVNTTMQTEAKSDHWPTYTWRPFIGFMFGGYIASMVLLPILHITPVTLSPDLTLAIGGILGIASYFRGKMQADPTVPTDDRG